MIKNFINSIQLILILLLFPQISPLFAQGVSSKNIGQEFSVIKNIKVTSLLGDAINISEEGRLKSLPSFDNGFLLKVFTKELKEKNKSRDWNGEHAGKWLYTTSKAAARTGDPALRSLVLNTADFIIGTQEPDGYIGTYSPGIRFTNPDDPAQVWSWDVWNASLMLLGLLEVNQHFPDVKYLDAAKKLGELVLNTFGDAKNRLTGYGTNEGSSATVLLDPVVEMYKVTGDKRYLNFAELIIKQIEEKEGFRLISGNLAKRDLETMADGKAYQLLWNLTALLKLYQVTFKADYLTAAINAWKNVVDYHLTSGGGPWGGIGKHYECFNRKIFWSPYGYTETCSLMSWIQMNKELLKITGDACYAGEIEKSVYNQLLGAQYPDGQVWCYHTFENGRRHEPKFTHCCSSSGAMALEEIPEIIYGYKGKGISCNIFTASEAVLKIDGGNSVKIEQETNYPFDGKIDLTISPEKSASFPLYVRLPVWASSVDVRINGVPADTTILKKGSYLTITRKWKKADKVEVDFPIELKVNFRSEEEKVPQLAKLIHSIKWFQISKGPLVFATNGLINELQREMVYEIPEKKSERYFIPVATPKGAHGPAYELRIEGMKPLLFLPFYEAGGRTIGSWHLTWIQQKID